MKRFVLLFLTAVLCFSLLVVPAFAEAGEPQYYRCSSSSSLQLDLSPGYYDLYVLPADAPKFDSSLVIFQTTKPIYIFLPDGLKSEIFPIDYSGYLFDSYLVKRLGNGSILLNLFQNGEIVHETYSYYFAPASLSLSDVVEQDVINNIFSEVFSILPAVLGVLVAFIAIRKGVSFTFSFVSEA